jgi:hypothetical protein
VVRPPPSVSRSSHFPLPNYSTDTASSLIPCLKGKTAVAHVQKSSPRCSGSRNGTRIDISASSGGRMGYRHLRFQNRGACEKSNSSQGTQKAGSDASLCIGRSCLSWSCFGCSYIEVIRYYPMHFCLGHGNVVTAALPHRTVHITCPPPRPYVSSIEDTCAPRSGRCAVPPCEVDVWCWYLPAAICVRSRVCKDGKTDVPVEISTLAL